MHNDYRNPSLSCVNNCFGNLHIAFNIACMKKEEAWVHLSPHRIDNSILVTELIWSALSRTSYKLLL